MSDFFATTEVKFDSARYGSIERNVPGESNNNCLIARVPAQTLLIAESTKFCRL